METTETGGWAEVLEADSVEQGVERGFERLSSIEHAEGRAALVEAFDDLARTLAHEVCHGAEFAEGLCGKLRGELQELAPEPGSLAEGVRDIAESALHTLERGAEWLRTHPQAAECAVRISMLAALVSTNPELAAVLVGNPEDLARYLDVGPLIEAGVLPERSE